MSLERAFAEIRHGIIVTDPEGRVVAVNKVAAELLNIQEGLVDLPASSIPPGRGIVAVLTTGRPVWRDKVAVHGRVLEFYHQPFSEEDRLGGVVTSFQDVTDWEAKERELESAKQQCRDLEAIFNSSFDEIFVTDGQGYTLRVNKAGQGFYGLDEAAIVGKHVSTLEEEGLFSPSITPQVIREKRRLTSVQTTRSGHKIIVTGNPVFDERGEIIRVVTNSRDITELSNLRQRLEETEKLMDTYRTELARLRKERIKLTDIVSNSLAMHNILELAERVAGVDSTVLIEGESGVGKGVVAAKIHDWSKRSEKPFVTVNCGAIPEALIETELFGYEFGAFTGAKKEGKKGLFELARGGTVFLDEITDLPLNLQVKLLHVIQERRIMRVGGAEAIAINVRIIAATNRDIKSLVKEKKFREDLYYRLNVVPVVIPPLRMRKEDIPGLIEHFLAACGKKYELRKRISAQALEYLVAYNWPGNVRELENLTERLVVTVDSPEILPEHLPDHICRVDGKGEKLLVLDICPLKEAMEELERQLLSKALASFPNTYRMAAALQVNQSTIVRKLHRYGISKNLVSYREGEREGETT
ncbi:limonene hydroxylase [Peptococcaceae bacterium CEB3]|nr:limonene hydroxylase [Peptococcaceae bacterium CEB3]